MKLISSHNVLFTLSIAVRSKEEQDMLGTTSKFIRFMQCLLRLLRHKEKRWNRRTQVSLQLQ